MGTPRKQEGGSAYKNEKSKENEVSLFDQQDATTYFD